MGKISDDDDEFDATVSPRSTWSDLSVWIFLGGFSFGSVFGFCLGVWF